MKLYKIIALSALGLTLSTPAIAERGDTAVSISGSITEDFTNINGGMGFMMTDSLKANLNMSLSYFDSAGTESTSTTIFIEGQYYFGNFYTSEHFLFSVGAGLLGLASDTTSSTSSTSDFNTGYHAFVQANQFFESYENASIFYRLQSQSVDGADATTALLFGVEIYF